MISVEELLELMKDNSFYIYETLTSKEDITTIELMNIDSLINFAKNHGIDTFFYHYFSLTQGDFLIDEEVISELRLEEEVLAVLENKFETYNEKLQHIDFTPPVLLELYCVHGGVIYSIEEEDYWFLKEGIDFPKTMAMSMATEYLEEIVEAKKNNTKKVYEERELLKKKILHDKEFQECTNSALRRKYAGDLIKDNPKVQKLFYSSRGVMRDIPITTFVEQIWKEYKRSSSKK